MLRYCRTVVMVLGLTGALRAQPSTSTFATGPALPPPPAPAQSTPIPAPIDYHPPGLLPAAPAFAPAAPGARLAVPNLPPSPPTPPVQTSQFAAPTPGPAAPPALPGTVVGTSPGTTLPAPAPAGPAAAEPKKEDKKDDEKKDKKDEKKDLADSLHRDEDYGLKGLFDILHPSGKGKPWYEKLSIRGYTQIRFGRTLYQDPLGADPDLLGDRSINGEAENFFIRRMRLIFFGQISDHLAVYIQPDFANQPVSGSRPTYFGQLRDAYADVYLDKEMVHRLRVGLSKVPYGFENMQSSQNRLPLDRTDPINSAVAPNERDLGVFYYWTPEDKTKLLADLVAGGLKGSGNYGIFALGVYNGQGGSQIEQNLNLYTVARLTWPFRLGDGQVVEPSIQAYTGRHVVRGADIRPLGTGDAIEPEGTGGSTGILDQRVAGTFVWYPQPFGFQAEWNVGQGPGLNDAQTAVVSRSLHGGYLMAMYKWETPDYGIFTPFARWQYYRGGYRSIANAPYGTHRQLDLGVEWQIRREMELVVEYNMVDGLNRDALDDKGARSYRNFDGGVFRLQFQFNY